MNNEVCGRTCEIPPPLAARIDKEIARQERDREQRRRDYESAFATINEKEAP